MDQYTGGRWLIYTINIMVMLDKQLYSVNYLNMYYITHIVYK